MPSRYQTGIGGKLGPQATAGSSGPYVGQPPSSVRNIQPKTVKPTATAQPQGLGRFFGGITRLGGAMQALNPNAPMLDRMIGSLTAGFPITGMTASTLQGAYNYGKNPYGGMSSIVETDLSSAIQAENSKADMKTIKEKMIKDAGGLEQYNKLYPAAAEGGYTISPKVRQELAEERVNPKVETEVPPPSVPTAKTGAAKLDPNATEEYKTAFNAGQKKMDDMLKYFGSQNNGKNLQTWARANPALAYKEFKKAGMTGKEPFGYNEVEFGKLKENPAEAAEKLGIKIYDGQVEQTEQQKAAQAFKNTMTEITKGLDLSKYNDLGYNPFQIDPGTLLEKSVDFNIPGLERTLGNYGTADYGKLLEKYPNIFSNK